MQQASRKKNLNVLFDFSASNPWKIFVFQIVSLLCLIYFCFHSNAHQWLICSIVYFMMVVVGGTVTYHRLLTHRSFHPKKWFAYVGPVLGSLIGAGSTIAWVANHRHHHQKADQPQDPHSPRFQPWYKIMWMSMFYRPRIKNAIDLMRSPFHLSLHNYYWLIHIGYFSVLYAIEPYSVIYAYLAPAALAWNAASSVNVLNHLSFLGYRNHNTKDHSTNNLVTGYLVGGEGFHNNHHAHPTQYQFGNKWFEFDIGAFLISNFFCLRKPENRFAKNINL